MKLFFFDGASVVNRRKSHLLFVRCTWWTWTARKRFFSLHTVFLSFVLFCLCPLYFPMFCF